MTSKIEKSIDEEYSGTRPEESMDCTLDDKVQMLQSEPKDDEPKDDEPKDDEPKDDEPKDNEPKDNEPKDDEPKDNEPKDNEPKDNEPKDNEPKDNEPKDNEPKDNEPKDNEPKDNEPKDNEPKDDEPKDDEPKDNEPKDDEPKDDEPKELHEELTILYHDTFSNFSTYLEDIFKGTNFLLKDLASIDDIYEYTSEPPLVFISDIPLDHGFEGVFIDLNDYITCPKVFVFESFDELDKYSGELSKFNIFGFAKDYNLKERLSGQFRTLGLLDDEDSFFEIGKLGIEAEVSLLCSVGEITEGKLIFSSPQIQDFINIDFAKVFLPNFNTNYIFSSEDFLVESDCLVIKKDTSEIIEQLHKYDFESHVVTNVAFISDHHPNYQLFHSLGVKINYYKSFEDYEGKEHVIIVEDKKYSRKRSSGTEICQVSNGNILIFSRQFPVEHYKNFEQDNVTALTSTFDLNAIKNTINNHLKNNPSEHKYVFDAKSDLGNAKIRFNSRIHSINESFVIMELPFKIGETSKIQVKFFGEDYMTALKTESNSNDGFLFECRLDNLCECDVNKIRQLLNKLNYLEINEVNLNQFSTIEAVMDYCLLDAKEAEGDAIDKKEGGEVDEKAN